ncbi:hypothetical protein QBC45DRAFT_407396 [Copromyces sp. CBS 386.78]|nr:hypothetical protein QBC45DRAFT_407396 [Copromyces sp. CBS 386.78]
MLSNMIIAGTLAFLLLVCLSHFFKLFFHIGLKVIELQQDQHVQVGAMCSPMVIDAFTSITDLSLIFIWCKSLSILLSKVRDGRE